MHLFTLEKIKDNNFFLYDSDIKHIKNVLRLEKGDKIHVIDNQNNIFLLEIVSLEPIFLTKKFQKIEINNEYDLNIHLYIPIINKNNFEIAISNAIPLHVNEITPVYFSRSQKNIILNIERCQKKIVESIKQCNRTANIKINISISFDQMLKEICSKDSISLVAYENTKNKSINTVLKNNKSKNINLIVGPEGGITINEIEKLKQIPTCYDISLTKSILRTELAIIYMLASIINILGEQ